MSLPDNPFFGKMRQKSKIETALEEKLKAEEKAHFEAYQRMLYQQCLFAQNAQAQQAPRLGSAAAMLTSMAAALNGPDVSVQHALNENIAKLKDAEAVKLSKPMPDHIATLTAYRAWRVLGDMLSPLGGTVSPWEKKKAVGATCLRAASHKAPVRDCECGYWSFKSMDLLQKALPQYANSVAVVGSVEIWGRVIECENGFRSEFAYPKELWLVKPDLEFLSWEYGVPVRMIDKS